MSDQVALPTSVRIEQSTYKAAKKAAIDMDITVSEFIVRAIKKELGLIQ